MRREISKTEKNISDKITKKIHLNQDEKRFMRLNDLEKTRIGKRQDRKPALAELGQEIRDIAFSLSLYGVHADIVECLNQYANTLDSSGGE